MEMINVLINVQITYHRSSGEEDITSSRGDQDDLLGSLLGLLS